VFSLSVVGLVDRYKIPSDWLKVIDSIESTDTMTFINNQQSIIVNCPYVFLLNFVLILVLKHWITWKYTAVSSTASLKYKVTAY